MKNLLISITTALVLFATSVLADHTMYIPGNIYRDRALVTCPTKEATLKVIQGMASTKYLTYGITRRLAELNNCEFHRDPVNFIISDLFCRTTTITGKAFTVARTLIEGKAEEKFTILYFLPIQRHLIATSEYCLTSVNGCVIVNILLLERAFVSF